MCDGNNIATRPLQNGVVVGGTVYRGQHPRDVLRRVGGGIGRLGLVDLRRPEQRLLRLRHVQQRARRLGDRRRLVRAVVRPLPPERRSPVRGPRRLARERPWRVEPARERGPVPDRLPRRRRGATGRRVDALPAQRARLRSRTPRSSARTSRVRRSTSTSRRATASTCPTARFPRRHTASNTLACIQISGTPVDTNERIFLTVGGCSLLSGDRSIWVKGAPAPTGTRPPTGGRRHDVRCRGRRRRPCVRHALRRAHRQLADRRCRGALDRHRVVPGHGRALGPAEGDRPVHRHRERAPRDPARGLSATRIDQTDARARHGLAAAVVTSSGVVWVAPVGAAAFPANASVHLDGVASPPVACEQRDR